MIKKRSKNKTYEFIKTFTNLLKRKQLLDLAVCENLVKNYNVSHWILKRLWSYFYNRPKLIWYINETVNNLFDFKKVSLEEHFIFLQQLYILHNMQPKDVYYLRRDEGFDEKRQKVIDLIKKYYKETCRWYRSNRDINDIWRLIVNGVIDNSTINRINKLINGEDSPDIVLDNLIPESQKSENISTRETEKIQQFIYEIKNLKLQRNECRKCELFNNQIVVLDTNVSEPQPVDFFFFGINPGREEREKDCPMIGTSGKLLREQIIDQLPINTKWVISNVILCSTNNASQIKDVQKCLENCKGLVAKIFEKFMPKYIVTIGDIPTKYFGIQDKISKVSGELLGEKVIPCVHPSSVRRGNKYMAVCFQKARKTILELARQMTPSYPQQQEINQNDSNNTNWLEGIDKSWSFFDCCRLDNGDILLIFIDPNGKKQYKRLRNIRQPVYIKYDNFKNCSIITDKVDAVVHLTDYQKNKLSQLLRQQNIL